MASEDVLIQAAQRAHEVLPPAVAKVIAYTLDRVRGFAHTDWPLAPELAEAVLSMSDSRIPTDTVTDGNAAPDRYALIEMLNEADLGGETSEKDMGAVFWRIEGNYNREGGGPGSRFEGKLLTEWQACWARMHLIPAIVDHLISAGVLRGQPTVTARQFDAAANLLAFSLYRLDEASDKDRELLRALLGVLGLSVMEGDDRAPH